MAERGGSERLWIMRHGQAGPGTPDAARELTARGRDEAARMAAWFATTLDAPTRAALRVVASPYRRAQQTALLMAERAGGEVETLDAITPDDPVPPVIDWLLAEGERGAGPILLVSHMPLVGELTARLVDGGRAPGLGFPTAAIAALEAEVWAAGCARLAGFHTPANIS